MASVTDIGVAGQPLATPPLTAWQAAVRDALGGSDVPVTRPQTAAAVKAADQASIASGGSAGFTATLTGVRIGQLIVAHVQAVFQVPAVCNTFVSPSPTNLSGTQSAPPQYAAAATQSLHQNAVWLFTATATTVTLGYTMTLSTAAAWTCKGQSAITLIAL